jgi:hypothetical protein
MMGALIPARIQGQVESILLARAISNAAALYGFVNNWRMRELFIWAPFWIAAAVFESPTVLRSWGDSRGEEKDKR